MVDIARMLSSATSLVQLGLNYVRRERWHGENQGVTAELSLPHLQVTSEWPQPRTRVCSMIPGPLDSRVPLCTDSVVLGPRP